MRLLSVLLGSATLAALSLGTSGLQAAQVWGPVAGGIRHLAPAGSDTWLAFPLREQALHSGRVTALQAGSITVNGLAGLADGTYSGSGSLNSFLGPRYYVEFVSGALAGLVLGIDTQTGAVLTLYTEGADLTTLTIGGAASHVLAVGDVVRIRRAWTVRALFEPTDGAPLIAPVAQPPWQSYVAGDALLFHNRDDVGVDLPGRWRMVYQDQVGWRGSSIRSVVPYKSVLPGHAVGVRRQAETDLAFTVVGYVPGAPGVCLLPAVAEGEERDVVVGWMRPELRTLGTSGLGAVLKQRPANGEPGDRVLFDTASAYGLDPLPAFRAERAGTEWEGESGENLTNHLLADDRAFVLRLRGVPQTRFWREGGAP
jgi:uncharacterized protein (TIGR02597 family)